MKARKFLYYSLLSAGVSLPSGSAHGDIYLQDVSSVDIPLEYKERIKQEISLIKNTQNNNGYLATVKKTEHKIQRVKHPAKNSTNKQLTTREAVKYNLKKDKTPNIDDANKSLNSTLVHQNTLLEAQNHTLAKKLSAETDKRSQLEQALTTARAQASQAQAQLAPLQARSTEQEKLTRETAALQQRLDTLTTQNHALEKNLSAETDKRSQLEQALTTARAQASQAQAQLAKLDASVKSQGKHPGTWADINNLFSGFSQREILSSIDNKHSYVIGLALSDEIKNKQKEMKNIGLNLEDSFFLAGLIHGYFNTSSLPKNKEIEIQQGISKTITDNINRNLEMSVLKIKKEVSGKKILPASTDKFVFTLDKEGSHGYKRGNTVTYNVTEMKLNGELIRSSTNNKVTYNTETPDYMRIAIKEAKKGGEISVYGLAINIYGNNIPPGIFADTPVKLQFNLEPISIGDHSK
ncbi:hypothetical protein ACS33_02500 [Edwardsiella ictaluri]|nr:hypothetical protein [Edwardsiella ictaluri]KMQ79484.1 hypothetical protein ABY58_01915 [Edwardsiella ictaluri]KOO56113.1 hypothetical protein ACS33_02500 [Edwardsiella ictaluri]